MVNRTAPPPTPLPLVWRALLLSRSLGWLGGFALLSSHPAWAQTDAFVDNLGSAPPPATTAAVPAAAPATPPVTVAVAKPEKAPTDAPPAPVAQPQPAPPPPAPVTQTQPAPPPPAPVAQPQPAPPPPAPVAQPAPRPQPAAAPPTPTRATTAPTAAPAPRLSPPTVSVPREPVRAPLPEALRDEPPAFQLPAPHRQVGQPGSTSRFVDPTAYGSPAREPQPGLGESPRVVVSDRARGCETVGRQGQLAQNCQQFRPTLPDAGAAAQAARGDAARDRSAQGPGSRPHSAGRMQLVSSPVPVPQVWAQAAAEATARRGYRRGPVAGGGPIQVVPMESGIPLPPGFINPFQTAAQPTDTQRPIYPNNGNRGLLFPLAIPARITSGFGWRQHPIFGTWRMHAGTDLGAAYGTPVVAAYRGQVTLADYAGGYGMMVVLRHLDGTQESRYAHLARIFVQPGEWVEQGELIGLVGSTGNSTGPHLHFEWRHHLSKGWVPVDAGPYLESALANLSHSIDLAAAGLDPQDFYATPEPAEALADADAAEEEESVTAAWLEELELGHAILGIGTFFLAHHAPQERRGAPPVGAAAAARPPRQPLQPQEPLPELELRAPVRERRQPRIILDSHAPLETTD